MDSISKFSKKDILNAKLLNNVEISYDYGSDNVEINHKGGVYRCLFDEYVLMNVSKQVFDTELCKNRSTIEADVLMMANNKPFAICVKNVIQKLDWDGLNKKYSILSEESDGFELEEEPF